MDFCSLFFSDHLFPFIYRIFLPFIVISFVTLMFFEVLLYVFEGCPCFYSSQVHFFFPFIKHFYLVQNLFWSLADLEFITFAGYFSIFRSNFVCLIESFMVFIFYEVSVPFLIF